MAIWEVVQAKVNIAEAENGDGRRNFRWIEALNVLYIVNYVPIRFRLFSSISSNTHARGPTVVRLAGFDSSVQRAEN
jgi:hypothetical protein